MIESGQKINAELLRLVDSLQPVKMRRVMLKIAQHLRKKNRQRIRQQRNAAGDKYKARKSGKGKKMLTGFSGHVRAKASAASAEVGVFGKAAGLAAVHNFGQVEDGIHYARRQLIGLSEEDAAEVERIIKEHIL